MQRIFLLIGVLFLGGCATYPQKARQMVMDFELQRYDLAIEKLRPLAEKESKDQVLHLLELGTVYHTAGKYEEAIKTFQQAEKIVDKSDYVSISQEAGSVVANENVKTHKIDDYEKVLISMYLAIDYTLLGQWEGAQIEARRVNHQLDKMIREGGHPTYVNNGFAKYLAALLFERNGEFNDAWVDYKQLYKWEPTFSLNSIGLLRMSQKMRSEEDFRYYKTLFPNPPPFQLSSKQGEIILLAEVGKAPEKIPDPDFQGIPKFINRPNVTRKIRVRSKNDSNSSESVILFDIHKAALTELQEKRAGLIAKRIASIALKKTAVTVAERASKDKSIGALGDLLILFSEQADLRSWLLLPNNLQVARLTLPTGKHELVIDELDIDGKPVATRDVGIIEVKPYSMNFLNVRSRL